MLWVQVVCLLHARVYKSGIEMRKHVDHGHRLSIPVAKKTMPFYFLPSKVFKINFNRSIRLKKVSKFNGETSSHLLAVYPTPTSTKKVTDSLLVRQMKNGK